jgi:hypothetical protein
VKKAHNSPTLKLVFRRLLLIAAVILLAAYPASRLGVFEWPRAYDPLALPDLAQKPGFLTSWQMRLVDFAAADCVLALQRAGITTTLRPVENPGGTCEISGAISMSRFSTARMRPEAMRCAIAARLYVWERHVLQPLAQKHFGQGIAEILHFGSYSCRPIRGGNSMSEHATANAFDISGFKLENGRVISLSKNWTGGGTEARFLREARDGLCDWFNATLSPDYNAAHADHFHVDMGWWQTCR